ncbi:DEAD/DEAH box helicase [Bittarella massiliensis (ex Durand et al. 2017)]|uniref:RNA helicase n=1 Tax=Bittarella massiliensis (ex Durand et al. 2017) TaxID=1720313 RepID=A0AAW5KB58_9FIRM|nr:DEAD/DEAH box helicase [Bittarella massiliensis (ex Durand et al. 2017)]MCQ4949230.1 DEAD/DEAH box helicase [Bittarella massiliensis (ex Durand et al. 2017)]
MNEIPFDQLGLTPELLRAVEEMGFTTATDIQSGTIPLIREGKDVIGRSQTGTGKTAAFAIPAIEMIEKLDSRHQVQVLLLCPTRELVMQAAEEVQKLSKYRSGVKTVAVYGGAPIDRQIARLGQGANFVIGTPGRVMDHIRRKTLKLDTLKLVILDEADEMLNMGFREDIETILSFAPEERQTVLFSATMPPAILAITKQYQREPEMVQINRQQVTIDAIEQASFEVPMGRKMDALNLVLRAYAPKSAIVFCNTKSMVDELTAYLNDHGFSAAGLHGDMKQSQRTQVMDGFKRRKTALLVATDVAARGIDVDDLDMVLNYDIPQNSEYYVHRIGRTGRAGKEGRAFTLVSGRKQVWQLRDIARQTRSTIEPRPIPTPEEIAETRRARAFEKMLQKLRAAEVYRYADMAQELCDEGFSMDQVAAMALEMLFGKEKHLIPQMVKAPVRGERLPRGAGVRIGLSIGREQHIAPNFIVGAIAERTDITGREIGKIEIYDRKTVVELPADKAEEAIRAIDGTKIAGRIVKAFPYTPKEGEFAAPRPRGPRPYRADKDRPRRPGRFPKPGKKPF